MGEFSIVATTSAVTRRLPDDIENRVLGQMSGFMLYPRHRDGGVAQVLAEISALGMDGRALTVACLALALGACGMFSARTPDGVEKAGAYVESAVTDTEEVARRALAYHGANIRKRAAIEVEEAEVILRKALDEQKRIRNVQRAAVAILAELQAKPRPDRGSEVTAAVARVDRINAILEATDRNIETIEQTVLALQELDIPGLR